MKALWQGKTIAESDNPVRIEGNWYFPPESVDMHYLKPSKLIYLCYWKGLARYYHLDDGKERAKNAAWYYRKPTWLSKKIVRRNFSNYVAFDYRVEVV